jgi:molybdenum cofactor biosynthesis enzyme MoaA
MIRAATFSICVGTNWCNAGCPFCISKATGTKAIPKPTTPDWDNFDRAVRAAQIDRVKNVLLTGTGEPTGYPDLIEEYLERMDRQFPFVDLQTNGILIDDFPLRTWRRKGLSTVCLSVASMNYELNQKLMRASDPVDIIGAIVKIQSVGLTARLNFTMMAGGVDSFQKVVEIVDWARELKNPIQLTFRDVATPSKDDCFDPAIYETIKDLQVDITPQLFEVLSKEAVVHLEYDYGGIVWGWKGQNLLTSNCITSDTDPKKQRQLIYFPNGEIGYDWKYCRSAFILGGRSGRLA